ncbi:MAG: ATP-binding cassette domain-containing protein [Oscillospiraceae bacterium]|nr:ATP-binding cassette domain-containing protein [Oscillospiraceae bacterium]
MTEERTEKSCEVILEARDVSFRYGGGPWILQNVNLAIKRGERVGLVGPSGYGKSTLSRILAGYERPTKGSVLWKGAPLPKRGYCPVQMIYQHPEKAVNPRWRIQDTLCEAWTPDDELLKELRINKELWFRRWPNELSGGELQRFCVARVLGPKTEFLIADEMSTMLDAITQAQIWSVLLDQVKKRDLGLLVITHSMPLAEKLCTRIVDLTELNLVGHDE